MSKTTKRKTGKRIPHVREGRARPARSGQSIAERMPEYALDWDYKENGDATPETVSWRSNHRASWKCHLCGKTSVRPVGGKAYTYSKEGPSGGCRGRLCPRRPRTILPRESSLHRWGDEVVDSFCLESNAPDTPDTVSHGAKRVLTWRCLADPSHPNYLLSLPSRRKTGCPRCSSIGCKMPELAAQWHPTKNRHLTPYDVTRGCHRRVWWQCLHGHEWQATVANRTHAANPTGCGDCQLAHTSATEIRLYAELTAVLTPTLGADSVRRQQRIPGLARTHGKGDILIRLRHGSTERLVVVEYDSAHYHAGREPNDQAKSDGVLGAGYRLIRVRERPLRALCPDDVECAKPEAFTMAAAVLHRMLEREWLDQVTAAVVRAYVVGGKKRGTGLATDIINDVEHEDFGEASLDHTHPRLARQLDPDANGHLTGRNLRADQSKTVWWRCGLGDVYKASAGARVRGRGCSYCAGKKVNLRTCLATVAPPIAAELDEGRDPFALHSGAHDVVSWRCSFPSCGWRWRTSVAARTKSAGSGCPACAGKVATPWRNLITERPDVAAIWHLTENLPRRPEEVLPGSNVRCTWLCPCNETFPGTVADRCSAKYQLCKNCARERGQAVRWRKGNQ